MPIYLSEKEAARAGLVTKQRRPRGSAARPSVPSAGPSPRTGLSTLIAAGWSLEYRIGKGYRLQKDGRSTDWQPSERAACDAAKGMER